MKDAFLLTYRARNGAVFSTDQTETESVSLAVEEVGARRKIVLTAKADVTLLGFEETLASLSGEEGKNDLFFLNGYQSWTDSFERTLSEKEKSLKKVPKIVVDTFAFDRYGDYTFYPYDQGKLHGYDLFYEKGARPRFLFNENAENAYLVIEAERESGKILLRSDVQGALVRAGESFTVANYSLFESFEDGLAAFNERYPMRKIEKIFGYTSWYNYYQNVNEEILLRDLDALDDTFDLFQIDDGFETKVGDWLSVDPDKFPNGLTPIVETIHSRGLKAGLWLAPFVAEAESDLFKERKDWFKKDERGMLIKCGSNWSGFYALDLENAEVLAYIEKCLKHYSDMGFDFFKLDFLYAANLPSYEGKTRSQAAESAYRFLRKCLPDRLILGCGATLSNAAGKFEYMRVGPDVSLSFDDAFYMRFFHRERPSTKTTVQNTIYRSFLNGRFFGNDPDVFLLRDENLKLKEKTKTALLTINALFGSVLMTSDNVKTYGEAAKEKMKKAFELFRHASVHSFERKGKRILIRYEADGKAHEIVYDKERGEFI